MTLAVGSGARTSANTGSEMGVARMGNVTRMIGSTVDHQASHGLFHSKWGRMSKMTTVHVKNMP